MTKTSGGTRRTPGPRPRGEAVVQAVLDAALDELARVGYAALSVEVVAERAGVNKTTIYRRFPAKSDLVAAALLREKAGLIVVPDSGSLHADLTAMVKAASRFLETPQGQGIFRMVLAERSDPEVAALAERIRRDGEREPIRALQRAIARGELDPDTDLELVLHLMFGPVIHRVLVEGSRLGDEEASRVADLMMHGIASTRVREQERKRRAR